MKLSFLPADLHLSKNAAGLCVVTLEGREVLSTKSERVALAKFHLLRVQLEKKYPVSSPETQMKDSQILDHNFTKPFNTGRVRISTPALYEVESALRGYYDALEASGLTLNSQAQYMDMADRFVRWLRGSFDPGSRV